MFHLFIKQIQKRKSDMSTWVDVGGGVVDDRDGFNIICLMWLSFSSGREACMANISLSLYIPWLGVVELGKSTIQFNLFL